MYTIETKKLLLLQEYADRVRFIVPEITEKETVVTTQQMTDLCNAGFSFFFLINRKPAFKGSMFNRTPEGLNLRREYEARKEKRFEHSLNHLLYHNSISICEEESFALLQAS